MSHITFLKKKDHIINLISLNNIDIDNIGNTQIDMINPSPIGIILLIITKERSTNDIIIKNTVKEIMIQGKIKARKSLWIKSLEVRLSQNQNRKKAKAKVQ